MKIVKKILPFIMVFLIFSTAVYAEPTSDELQEQAEYYEEEAEELQEQVEQVEAEMTELQEQLTDLMLAINTTEEKLIAKGEEVIKASEELVLAEEREIDQQNDMEQRIVAMYEKGDSSILELLFESRSIAEMLTRAENVQAVYDYDRNALNEYIETKNKVKNLKETLETEQAELEELLQENNEKKQQLDALIAEKESEVNDFQSQLVVASERAAEAAAEAARVAAEEEAARIEAEEEAARKEAEEAARKEAEEAARKEAEEAARKEAEEAARKEAEEAAKEESEETEEATENSSDDTSTNDVKDESDETQEEKEEITAGDGDAIVAAAYTYLGVPYVWGGTSYSGVDCSGLTMLAHQAAGISITRVSYLQSIGGKSISSLEEALPGDIICYPGHVAIYIGNYQVIHAPHTGDVVKVASVYMGGTMSITAIRRYW